MIVLIAPGRHASRKPGAADALVTYESIRDNLAESVSDDPRLRITLDTLSAAIEKAETGYNPASDRPVTGFWRPYWKLASERIPELRMREPPAKPSGAGFIWFFPDTLPGEVDVCHKLMKGFVDLHFPGWGSRVSALEARIARIIESDTRVAKAAKSGAVRVRVPVLYTNDSSQEQRPCRQGARCCQAAVRLGPHQSADCCRMLLSCYCHRVRPLPEAATSRHIANEQLQASRLPSLDASWDRRVVKSWTGA